MSLPSRELSHKFIPKSGIREVKERRHMDELFLSYEDVVELRRLNEELDRWEGIMAADAENRVAELGINFTKQALGAIMVRHRKVLMNAYNRAYELSEEDPPDTAIVAAIQEWQNTPVDHMPAFLGEGQDLYLRLSAIALNWTYEQVHESFKAQHRLVIKTRGRVKNLVFMLITTAPTGLLPPAARRRALQVHDETLVESKNEQRDDT